MRFSAQDGRVPASPDVERATLGAMLLDVPGTDDGIRQLQISDFFLPAHASIFAVLRSQIEAGRRPDLVSLVDALCADGKLEAIPGGAAYVAGLLDGVHQKCPLPDWIDSLQQKSALRQRARIGEHIWNLAIGANGNSGEVLEEIRRLAFSLAQEEPRRSGAYVLKASEFLRMTVEAREQLLNGLLTKRMMAEIFSWRGLGKTWVGLGIAHAIATAGTFWKWTAEKPRPVLFIDGELDAASLQQRIRHLDSSADCPADKLKLLCCDMQDNPFPNLAGRSAQVMIEDALGDAELLMLDNLSALAPSSNEREGEDWIAIQSWLLDLRRRGVASLFLHHAGHSGWARGTTRREDLLDLVIELRRPKDYAPSEGLRVEVHFTKTRGRLGDGAEPIEASLGTNLDGKLAWTWRPLEDKRTQQVIELRQAGHSFREIEKLTDIPRSTAERLFRQGEAAK